MKAIFKFLAIAGMMLSGAAYAADNQTLLAGKDLEMAKEMNDAYARHLYSSTCVSRQKSYFLPQMLSAEEQAKRIKGFQASCDCMAGLLVQKTNPNAVIEYVTQVYGTQTNIKTGKDGKFRINPAPHQKMIGDLTRDKDERRKCGFQK